MPSLWGKLLIRKRELFGSRFRRFQGMLCLTLDQLWSGHPWLHRIMGDGHGGSMCKNKRLHWDAGSHEDGVLTVPLKTHCQLAWRLLTRLHSLKVLSPILHRDSAWTTQILGRPKPHPNHSSFLTNLLVFDLTIVPHFLRPSVLYLSPESVKLWVSCLTPEKDKQVWTRVSRESTDFLRKG